MDVSPLSSLPAPHQSTAHSLKGRLEWLIADELVSIGRQATPISQALLQAVVAHVQMTQSIKCFSRGVPLRFVFGSNHSLAHFLQQLEALQVPSYMVNKTDDYYYLSLRAPSPGHAHRKLSLELITEDEGRSKTPPPFPMQPCSRVHRRSLSSGYPRGHAPTGHAPSSRPESVDVSAAVSRESLGVSGYDASVSCSVSSVSVEVCGGVPQAGGSWVVLRPLPHRVEVCLQVRTHVYTLSQKLCVCVCVR